MATVSSLNKTTTSSGTITDTTNTTSLAAYPNYGSDGYAYLFGNDEMNTIYGGIGNDKIFGAGGSDTLYGGAGSDVLFGESGNDWLFGDSGSDTLFGGAGRDALSGGDGNDRLNGGTDKDFLFGGAGSDTFEFNLISDSTPGLADIIDDYSKLQGDVLDLSKIDAMAGGTLNDSFHWVSEINSSNANGALWIQGNTLFGSTNSDAAAEFSVTIYGVAGQSDLTVIL